MIRSLLMAWKQSSDFENYQIVAYDHCESSLCDITKKLNSHYSLINIFLKNFKKSGNFPSFDILIWD